MHPLQLLLLLCAPFGLLVARAECTANDCSWRDAGYLSGMISFNFPWYNGEYVIFDPRQTLDHRFTCVKRDNQTLNLCDVYLGWDRNDQLNSGHCVCLQRKKMENGTSLCEAGEEANSLCTVWNCWETRRDDPTLFITGKCTSDDCSRWSEARGEDRTEYWRTSNDSWSSRSESPRKFVLQDCACKGKRQNWHCSGYAVKSFQARGFYWTILAIVVVLVAGMNVFALADPRVVARQDGYRECTWLLLGISNALYFLLSLYFYGLIGGLVYASCAGTGAGFGMVGCCYELRRQGQPRRQRRPRRRPQRPYDMELQ